MPATCRLCLKSTTASKGVVINKYSLDSENLTDKLRFCIPEIDITLIKMSLICESCVDTVNKVFDFKCNCLESEQIISDYVHVNGNIETWEEFDPKLITKRLNDEIKADQNEIDVIKHSVDESESYLPIKQDEPLEPPIKIKPENDLITKELPELPPEQSTSQNVFESVFIEEPSRPPEEPGAIQSTNAPKMRTVFVRKLVKLPENFNLLAFNNGIKMFTPQNSANPVLPDVYNKPIPVDKEKPAIKPKKFSCTFCSYKCASKSNLGTHVLIHTGEKSFLCEICSRRFTLKSQLKTHILTHTKEKPFACEFCTSKFSRAASLRDHIRTHSGEKPFECDVCNRKFSMKATLKKHVEIMHSTTGTHHEKPFACHICDSTFSRPTHLKQHIKRHAGEKPHQCEICGGFFSQKTVLQKHMRRHTGEKPFECEICKRKFSQQSALRTHVIILHTEEKRYECGVCGKKFCLKSYLQKHIQKAHSQEPSKPTKCLKLSAQRSCSNKS